jgi:3-oxoacyl-[acyl-carrier-protein] synthase II
MDFTKKTINLRRVVITGMGMISPVGRTVSQAWDNIKKGKSGIAKITRFDASGYYCRIAGEIKDYDPFKYFEKKELKK